MDSHKLHWLRFIMNIIKALWAGGETLASSISPCYSLLLFCKFPHSFPLPTFYFSNTYKDLCANLTDYRTVFSNSFFWNIELLLQWRDGNCQFDCALRSLLHLAWVLWSKSHNMQIWQIDRIFLELMNPLSKLHSTIYYGLKLLFGSIFVVVLY